MSPRLLVAKRGAILSFENLPRVRFTMSARESLALLSTTSSSPPMALRTSSDSQVFRLFLYAVQDLAQSRIRRKERRKDVPTYPMNRCNCLGLMTLGKEVLGRLEEMEEEESSHKHQKYHSPNSDIEISPAPIVSFRAAWWSRDVTRIEVRVTRIIREKTPGNE